MCADIEELISLCAKCGNAELCRQLRELQEQKQDPNYESETTESESECSQSDIVDEQYIINPSNNGFCEIVDCNTVKS